MIRLWVGETVRVRVRFRTESKQPMAVTGVSISCKDPDGITTTASVIPDAEVGSYHADIAASKAGVWYVRSECTGPTPAAEEQRFIVQRSNVL